MEAEEGPVFSNGTEGDTWYAARCHVCALRDRQDGVDGPCDDFFFVAVVEGGWPGFIARSETGPMGRECLRFVVDSRAD